MPHGGYHGTVEMGGNVVQQGYQDNSGNYQVRGGIDDSSRLDFNPPQSNQNNQNINQQIENKKKEIEDVNNAFSDLSSSEILGLENVQYGAPAEDTKKGLATLQNIQNQQLNNLLRQQQERNLATQLRSTFAKAGTDKADALRPLFTGDLGDKSFFGINLGSTETTDKVKGLSSGLGAATVINPFTGERITTGKVREGMTSPEYAQYMSELYGLNPALMEETFPFGSGQVAKPILARISEGIMGIPGASEIGQLAGDAGSAIGSVFPSGIFSGKKTLTPKIQYDNMGNPVGIISQLPESDGEGVNLKDFVNTPKLDLGQYSAIPEEYKGFFESEFAKPVAGGKAITYVTLPDGRRIRFDDTGSAAQFRKYLESIGVTPQEEPTEKVEVKTAKEEKAPFDYASIAPQFTGSPYTNQGVSPAFLENLRRFYG